MGVDIHGQGAREFTLLVVFYLLLGLDHPLLSNEAHARLLFLVR